MSNDSISAVFFLAISFAYRKRNDLCFGKNKWMEEEEEEEDECKREREGKKERE